MVVVFMF